MKTAIFIRSHLPDFEFLSYCLRSIQKFATGFDRIVIAVPQGQEQHLRHLTVEKVVPVHDEAGRGYLNQQKDKLNADILTKADMVFNLDSDCVLNRPINPQMFMAGDRPRWMMTPWKDVMEAKKNWFHIMCKCVQECPEHEFMRRHGLMIPAWAYVEFRAFIQATHGVEMQAYVMNVHGNEFSEFNCLGFYLWKFHRDKIHWHDTSVDGIPEASITQAWSWGGLTQELRNQYEILLA